MVFLRGTGQFQSIYGREIKNAVELIRGEAGSTLRLRVVRASDQTSELQEQVIEIQREQIILKGT